MRETRGNIDFRFNQDTAPPDVAQGRKICMWTISPTIPTEQFRYNWTIRNVNLNCAAGDRIAINFFQEESNSTSLGNSVPGGQSNPLCIESHEVWTRENEPGTTMVVILFVHQVVYGNGFFMQWQEGYDSRITPSRIRNTYYSWGKPNIDPNPYFAMGFFSNEISTFGFVKANYTDGYRMELRFFEIKNCEGQSDWETCAWNICGVYSIEDTGALRLEHQFYHNETILEPDPAFSSPNGLFIMVKIENKYMGGGRFSLTYDTVRG